MGGFEQLDPEPVFQRPQLLQLLELLERGGFQMPELQQEAPLVAVEPDVLVGSRLAARGSWDCASPRASSLEPRANHFLSDIRDRRPREIEGVPIAVDHDFHHVRIGHVVLAHEQGHQRSHGNRPVPLQELRDLLHHLRLHQRLIALDIHHHLLAARLGDFRHALGAAAGLGAGHDRHPTEALHGLHDALIFRRDHHLIDAAGLRHALIDMLDHRPSLQQRQRLPWKPAGAIPCWNHR